SGRGGARPQRGAAGRPRPRARSGARRPLLPRPGREPAGGGERQAHGARARSAGAARGRPPARGDRAPSGNQLRDRAHPPPQGLRPPRRLDANPSSRDGSPSGLHRVTGSLRPALEVAALHGEVDAVMRGIVDRLMELPLADGASMSTLDDGIVEFRHSAGEDLPLEGRSFPLEETLGAACIERGDVTVLRQTTGPEVDGSLTPGALSIALVPLEWNGRVRGILGVRSRSPDAFDAAGVEEIRMLGVGASIALRNAELLERLMATEEDVSQHKQNEERLRTSLGRL